MRFFSAPYEIVASDAAGGCQCRYLTDGAFQDEIWEEILMEARAANAASELEAVEWVVRERYVRGLAVTESPERVATLSSLCESGDASALHLFTRVLRCDGTPLACAFATLGCTARESAGAVPLPRAIADALAAPNGFREVVTPSFIEAALSERDEEALIPAEVRALAPRVLGEGNGVTRRSGSRLTSRLRASGVQAVVEASPSAGTRQSGALTLSLPGFSELAAPVRGAVFTFPDDRSYDGRLLRELHAYLPYLADHFHQADDVARRYFRQEFLPLVEVETLALHDQRLERCPELAHLGVVLCGVLIAETLQEHGIRPEVLIGDGLGELSALAVAGAIDVATALRLAAQRALALRRMQQGGNGDDPALVTVLADITFATPRFQIFLAGAEGPFPVDAHFGRVLATWLTRVASFDAAAAAVRAAGCEQLIECGPGGVLAMAEAVEAATGVDAAVYRDGIAAANVPALRRAESRHDVRT